MERGELAKQSSGAICRHRPHFGRKGKDLVKNRKGQSNPKKKKAKQELQHLREVIAEETEHVSPRAVLAGILLAVFVISLTGFVAFRS